jgi:hypothetical protein
MSTSYKDVGQKPTFSGFCFVILLTLSIAARLDAQVVDPAVAKPSNSAPFGPVADFSKPIHYGGIGDYGNVSSFPHWWFGISPTYLFLSDRSRVGGISANTNAALLDFTAAHNYWPFTSFDITYSHAVTEGSSPTGTSQNAHGDSLTLSILQPLDWRWDPDWTPANLHFGDYRNPKPPDKPSDPTKHFQNAIILSGQYGKEYSSLGAPQTVSKHGYADPFVGSAFYDFQFAYFPHGDERLIYPNFLLEFTTGLQFSTLRFGDSAQTSAVTSISEEVVYRDILSLTCSPFVANSCDVDFFGNLPSSSLWKLLGFTASFELDNPLSVEPARGSRPFYATTAIFSGGLVYNFYPKQHQLSDGNMFKDIEAWSLSLLYSYKAFDPLTEANQLQVQISFAF